MATAVLTLSRSLLSYGYSYIPWNPIKICRKSVITLWAKPTGWSDTRVTVLQVGLCSILTAWHVGRASLRRWPRRGYQIVCRPKHQWRSFEERWHRTMMGNLKMNSYRIKGLATSDVPIVSVVIGRCKLDTNCQFSKKVHDGKTNKSQQSWRCNDRVSN